MRVAGGVLDLDDLLEDGRVVARQEGAPVDDHVDLVGTRLDRGTRLGQLDVAERLAAGEPGRDAGDLHVAPLQRVLRLGDHRRVDADRRDGRDGRVARLWVHGLDAQRPDLAGRVLPLERRQIHHPDGQVEGPQLRRLLDRPPLRARRRAPRRPTWSTVETRPSRLPSGSPIERVRPSQARMSSLARSRARVSGALGGGHGTERIPLGSSSAHRETAPARFGVASGIRRWWTKEGPGWIDDGSWRWQVDRRSVIVIGAGTALAADRSVAISGFTFSPRTVTVNVGDTVTWTNSDAQAHTATSGSAWSTGDIAQRRVGVDHVLDGGYVRLHLRDPPDDDRHGRGQGRRRAADRYRALASGQNAGTPLPTTLALLGLVTLVAALVAGHHLRGRATD